MYPASNATPLAFAARVSDGRGARSWRVVTIFASQDRGSCVRKRTILVEGNRRESARASGRGTDLVTL